MGKFYKRAIVCCCILIASMYPPASAWMEGAPSAQPANDQVQSYDLAPVTVTATKVQKDVKKLPADMTVITAQQIKDMNAQSLEDVLRVVPGVQLLSYGASNMDQNLNGIRINGSKDIILLIDGVKVSDLMGAGEGGYIFASMIKNMDSIERIEVLRNGGTVLYGSGAKGGVINIITKKKFKNKNSLSISTGSYQSNNYKISSEGNTGKLNYQLYFNRYVRGNNVKDAHGFVWPGKEHQSVYGINLNYSPDKNNTFRLLANDNTNYFTNYDWWYHENVTDGKYHAVDFTFSYDHTFSDHWKNSFTFRNNMVETKGGLDTGANLWYSRYSYQFLNDTVTYQSKRYQGVLGIEHSLMKPRDKASTSYQLSIPIDDPPDPFWGPFEREITVSVENLKMENTSLFWNNTFRISPKIELTAGLRHDRPNYMGRYTADTEAEMSKDENKPYYGYGLPKFASHTSKAFKLTFYPTRKDTFYIGRSDFFVIPSISQLNDNEFGNIKLKPSEGWNSEIGYIHAFNEKGNNYMTFNLWNRKGKDAIGMDEDGQWVNYGSEDAAGWNLQIFKQIGNNTQVSVGWSQFLHDNIPQNGQYYADNFAKGYEPRTVLTWMVDHRINKLDMGLDGRYFVRQKYVNNYDYPGWPTNRYAVTNLSFNYSPDKQTRVTFKINNLFNKWYGEMTQAAWGGRDEFYTMPGRNYTLGVEYTF